jgi:hypothetical protein
VQVLKQLRLAFGGFLPPNTGATEEYNGATWTSSPASMSTARRGFANAGTQAAALAAGGEDTANSAATEEWTGAAPTTVTITAS